MKRQRIGSIDETTAGHHRVRVRTPSGGRETLGTYPTREEAERMRDAAMSILVAETDLDGVRLGVYIDRWLTDRQLRKAVRDPRSERMWFERYVVGKPLASIAVRSVRRRHVKAWLRTTKLKGQSAKNALQVVRGALWAAVDEELVRGNPAADIRVPGVKRTETPWTFLSLEEQRRLAASVEGPEAELLRFAIWSGLRAGELCTLRLADVHLDGPNPHVVVRYGTAPALPTKTGTIREVPLFGEGLAAVRRWLVALPRFAPRNPHGLLFPRQRGAFRDEGHVLRFAAWKAAKARAGLTRRVRWHDLRHTCASSLISGWWGRAWTLVEVSAMLGHASLKTTERYAHLAGTALQAAGRQTEAALAPPTPPAPPAPGGAQAKGTEASGTSSSAAPPRRHSTPAGVPADAGNSGAAEQPARGSRPRRAYFRGIRKMHWATTGPRIHGTSGIRLRNAFFPRFRKPQVSSSNLESGSQQNQGDRRRSPKPPWPTRGPVGDAEKLGVALLRVAAAGRVQAAGRLARMLAGEVLGLVLGGHLETEGQPARLAGEVLEDGPFALTRAIELAAVVVPDVVDRDLKPANGQERAS